MADAPRTLVAEVTTRPRVRTAQVRAARVRVHEDSGGIFDATVDGQQISTATLHIFSARLDGSFVATIRNVGRAPLFRSALNDHGVGLQGKVMLFDGGSAGLGSLRRGVGVPVETGWSVQGPIEVLWALIQILLTGYTEATEHIRVSAVGFNKVFDFDLIVPVQNITIAWD